MSPFSKNDAGGSPADDQSQTSGATRPEVSVAAAALVGTAALSVGVDASALPPAPHNVKARAGIGRKSAANSLQWRISSAFAALTLAFALVLGILAVRLTSVDGLSAEAASHIFYLILFWGLGAVLAAALLGAIFAKRIVEPIKRLTMDIQSPTTTSFGWATTVYRDYAELEDLSVAMSVLAATLQARDLELKHSERRFREAFDLVGVGLMQVDPEGRYRMVNRRFCEMLGYAANDLIGKSVMDFAHPDDRDADFDMIRSQGKGQGAQLNQEKRYIRKDGSVLWTYRSAVAIDDANGNMLYGLGSVEDISKYHAAQESLRALNASLKAIVETSPLAIYSITPAGVITLWNPAAERIFGLSEADVLGHQSSSVSRDKSHEPAFELRARVMAGETITGVETTWDGGVDGRRMDISVSAAPLMGQSGDIVGILVTCSDITAMKTARRQLDEQLRFMRELLEVMPNPIFYKSLDGTYLGFNRAWEQFYGLERDQWVGKTYPDVFGDEPEVAFEGEDADVLAGRSVAREVRIRNSNGEQRDIIKHISRFTSPDGSAAGLIGVMTDITDFKKVAQALEATEGRFQALTESAMDIVTVLDQNAIIIYQSPSVKRMLGYEPADMVGKCQYDLVHRDDVGRMRVAFEELVSGEKTTRPIEFRVLARDGTWRSMESIGTNCLDVAAVNGVVVNTRDVSERRVIQEHIQHLAFHDALTGLPNRTLMQDRISQTVTRAARSNHQFAVMFIDIDNFKNINDTLGHDAGDELLCEVARRLSKAVRARDTIARQGGDEFIVLLDELEGQQGATRVAQKVLAALRSAFVVNGADQHVSGSVGVAVFPDDGRDAATLLKNADTAMFHSKALGKNTYQFFTAQMNIAVKRRAAMESKLRAAVKDGAFSLVYQPQIDLVSGAIVALEALVRWKSEESGTIMPNEFIPLAEETGLINELGSWVLREACRQCRAWLDAGLPPYRIAVNISARQLNDRGFLGLLLGILRDNHVAPELLELELTESQIMRQGEGSVMLLNEIADAGVQLAIDDFGTGYSSLSYLKRLPIRRLKIDQSFIRDITVDPNDAAIVVAIISMAKSLDLDVIAEGIETAGQLALLRSKGCSVGQGYYFSVPLTAQELEPLLRRSSVFDPLGGSLLGQ